MSIDTAIQQTQDLLATLQALKSGVAAPPVTQPPTTQPPAAHLGIPTPMTFRFESPANSLQVNFNALADGAAVDPTQLATLLPLAAARMNVAYNYGLGWASSSGHMLNVQMQAEWLRRGGDPNTINQLINTFNGAGKYNLGVGYREISMVSQDGTKFVINPGASGGRHSQTFSIVP